MYDDYDEIYEISEIEELIDETTDKIIKILQERGKFELNHIFEFNKELIKENQELREQVNEIAEKKAELEIERQNLRQEIRQEKISELFADREIILYKPEVKYILGDKCDKCDDKRQLQTKSIHSDEIFCEYCECNKSYREYFAIEYYCFEIQHKDRYNKEFSLFYRNKKHYNSDEDYMSYHCSNDNIYIGQSFEEIKKNEYEIFFKTKEDCQEYCNWRNRKE